ncbi:MAG: glutamate racemase [Pseudomonadota bacterium]
MAQRAAPIGVFDSGMGGLTVLRALQAQLPHASFVYLGDTARLPYGTKSAATVARYAVQAARILVDRGVGALVIACNTASAVALNALREAYADLPVFGVVQPGAAAACAAAGVRRVSVLATESTVRGGAYQRALLGLRPDLQIRARPAPLLVTLAEEGWLAGEVPDRVLGSYVSDCAHWRPDVLLLGCTHFPVFREPLARILGAGVTIVDSAATTAAAVAAELSVDADAAPPGAGSVVLLATDDGARFARVGAHFLGEPIEAVEVVDLF